MSSSHHTMGSVPVSVVLTLLGLQAVSCMVSFSGEVPLSWTVVTNMGSLPVSTFVVCVSIVVAEVCRSGWLGGDDSGRGVGDGCSSWTGVELVMESISVSTSSFT